jgi:hypothetical protein
MRFNKKKIISVLDQKDMQKFCKNLKKFKKHHPNFDIDGVMKKLYPNMDLKDICGGQ